MTGNELIEIMYLVAIPVGNNPRKVHITAEDGRIRFAALGMENHHNYATRLGKGMMTKLTTLCTWDEKCGCWVAKATQPKEAEKLGGLSAPSLLNQNKYNNKKHKDEKVELPLTILQKNYEIKKVGDNMTNNQVIEAEVKALKENGQPVTRKRYERVK